MKFNFKELCGKSFSWIREVLIIVWKELRANFTNTTAYIVIAVFLAILEFLYFSSLLNINLVYIQPLLDNIPWMFLFLVPAITMSAIAQEKKEGTIEFYLTQPISEVQLLIGKFLASFAFIVIATLLTLPAVFSVASYGTVDWGQIFAQYIGVLSLAFVLTAIGVYMSSLVQNQISAFLLSVLVSFILIMIGLETVTSVVPVWLGNIFEKISLYSHYTSLSGGALDFRDLIYFAAVSSLFLISAYIPLIKTKFGKKDPIYNKLQAVVILLAALSLSIAFLGNQIPGRIDLTQNKIYTLSSTTKEIIQNASDVINITVYQSSNLPSQWQPQSRDIEEMLNDYETYGKGNVIVTYKYPDKDSSIKSEATSAGITPMQFNTREDDQLSVQVGYLGIEISYLDESEVIAFVEETSDLEYQITSLINKLTAENKPTIVFWESGVSHSISSDYTYLANGLKDQFEVDTFEYSDENKTLPENTTVLVLAGPSEEFSEEEKNLIKDYINNGGAVFALIDSVSVDTSTLAATVNSNSLKDVFENYGFSIKDELVYDLQYSEVVTVGDGTSSGNSYLAQYPFWIKVVASDDSNLTRDLDMLTSRWISHFEISEIEGADYETLLSTSKYGAVQNSETFDIALGSDLNPSSSEMSERIIAATYSKDLGNDVKSRIAIVADSDLLIDSNIYYSNVNLQFGLNVIEWLAQSSSLSEIRAKNRSLTSLVFEDDWESTMLQYGNIVGIVIAVSAIGGFIIIRRSKKAKKQFELE